MAAGENNSGLRAQTSISAARPGVLKDPAPQGAVTVGYVAARDLSSAHRCCPTLRLTRRAYPLSWRRGSTDNSQLRVDKVIDAPIFRWCEFHGCRRGEDSCAPTVASAQKLVTCSSELRGRLLGPCTQVQGRGSCPQGHGPHHLVHLVRRHG